MTAPIPVAQTLAVLSLVLLPLGLQAAWLDTTPRTLGLTVSQESLPAAHSRAAAPFRQRSAESFSYQAGAIGVHAGDAVASTGLAWPDVTVVDWHTAPKHESASAFAMAGTAEAGWQRLRRQVVNTPDISGSDGALAFPTLFALSGLIRLKKRKPS